MRYLVRSLPLLLLRVVLLRILAAVPQVEVHRQTQVHQVVVLHQVEARLLMGIMTMSGYSSIAKYKQLQSFQNLQAGKIGLFVKFNGKTIKEWSRILTSSDDETLISELQLLLGNK